MESGVPIVSGAIGRPPFTFIVGAGRSGTTLLRAMLDSHPDVAVPPETLFLIHLIARRGRYEGPSGFDRDAFVADLLRDAHLEPWNVRSEELAKSIHEQAPSGFADAIRTLFQTYAEFRGKPGFGYKMNHGPSLGTLAALLPEARFVHLIRDGRNVALAVMESDFAPRYVDDAAFEWQRQVKTTRHQGRRLGSGRYLELKFEQLVTAPDEALRTMCDFVELEFRDEMLLYFDRTNETVDPVFAHRHRGLAMPPTPRLRDFRSQMDAKDVALVELHAGDLLSELGYGLSRSKISLGSRALGTVRAGQLHSRRYGRALLRLVRRQRLRWPYRDVLDERTGLPTPSHE